MVCYTEICPGIEVLPPYHNFLAFPTLCCLCLWRIQGRIDGIRPATAATLHAVGEASIWAVLWAPSWPWTAFQCSHSCSSQASIFIDILRLFPYILALVSWLELIFLVFSLPWPFLPCHTSCSLLLSSIVCLNRGRVRFWPYCVIDAFALLTIFHAWASLRCQGGFS